MKYLFVLFVGISVFLTLIAAQADHCKPIIKDLMTSRSHMKGLILSSSLKSYIFQNVIFLI